MTVLTPYSSVFVVYGLQRLFDLTCEMSEVFAKIVSFFTDLLVCTLDKSVGLQCRARAWLSTSRLPDVLVRPASAIHSTMEGGGK